MAWATAGVGRVMACRCSASWTATWSGWAGGECGGDGGHDLGALHDSTGMGRSQGLAWPVPLGGVERVPLVGVGQVGEGERGGEREVTPLHRRDDGESGVTVDLPRFLHGDITHLQKGSGFPLGGY